MTTIDTVSFFDALATEMNAHPEAYEVLGDVDMDLAIVMRRPDADDFRLLLALRGISCEGVTELDADDLARADCWVEGDLSAWQTMFDDVLANGRATGRQTINSLTLIGDDLVVRGTDPMGVDKFFRFNQTVQAFIDGAAAVSAGAPT